VIKSTSCIKMSYILLIARLLLNLIRTCVGTSSLESTKRNYEVSNFDFNSMKFRYHSASILQYVFPVGSKPHLDLCHHDKWFNEESKQSSALKKCCYFFTFCYFYNILSNTGKHKNEQQTSWHRGGNCKDFVISKSIYTCDKQFLPGLCVRT